MFKKSLFCACLLALSGSLHAHSIWTEPTEGEDNVFVVAFGGHDGELEQYDLKRLSAIRAVGANGEKLGMDWQRMGMAILLKPQGETAVLTLAYDNGYWSTLESGRSVNQPMNEVKGAVKGVHAMKYHKHQAAFTPAALAVQGQPVELLLSEQPQVGKPFDVQVLVDGRPASGMEVAFNEQGVQSTYSDDRGMVSMIAQPGLNMLWTGTRTPLVDDPAATELSIEYTLVFRATE